jgi:hypothetical protein
MVLDQPVAGSQPKAAHSLQAMLRTDRTESTHDFASTNSEKSAASGHNPRESPLSRLSKPFSPSSSAHDDSVQDQKLHGNLGSNEVSYNPEWRKTKRKFAKRTCFIGVLTSISGNEVERRPKKQKSSTHEKVAKVDISRKASKVKFHKHSIARLLSLNARNKKPTSHYGVDESSGRADGKGAGAAVGRKEGGSGRRRSKRERHVPQKLDSFDVIQEVNDHDVVFGRPNGGTSLAGNRFFFKLLCDSRDVLGVATRYKSLDSKSNFYLHFRCLTFLPFCVLIPKVLKISDLYQSRLSEKSTILVGAFSSFVRGLSMSLSTRQSCCTASFSFCKTSRQCETKTTLMKRMF